MEKRYNLLHMLSIGYIDARDFASEIVLYLRRIFEIDRAMEFEAALVSIINIGKSLEGNPNSTPFRILLLVFRFRGILGGWGV